MTCAVTLGILITSSMAGFALAKYRFRGREFIFFSMLSTMMVPFFVLMIPLYYMMKEFGWLNSYWGLILPNIVTAFGIFLMRQFTFGVPTELLQAARIDGASEWWIYLRVVLPLTKPALAALGIFAFVYQWDSFLWPLLVVQSKSLWTVPLGVNSLRTFINAQQNMNLVMTGATLAVVPSLLVFLFLQKYFVKGITLSGFKG
ncbi:MAG: carbohydrate ABC transporter permease [Alicyclobacillus sp.]|nr:carbohydrate ABC transporter permease [Alicyclobacillus sp.]